MNQDIKRLGIVLSGGGAKGAYEVGVFRALASCGLVEKIHAFSGCSIGAYNELLYAMSGIEEVRKFLYAFPTLIISRKDGGKLLSGEKALYSSEGIATYLKNAMGGKQNIRPLPKLYACAYSVLHRRPEYFLLNSLTMDEAVNACIASGSLPDYFVPAIIQGMPYTDGGVVPLQCSGGEPGDKIPLSPLLYEDLDCILTVFLNAENTVDSSAIPPSCRYYELRPSEPLESSPHSGTLDFSPPKLQHHEDLGFSDMNSLLVKIGVL